MAPVRNWRATFSVRCYSPHMWDIGSGASAVLGALVGGGVTYSGTWLNIRFQSRQAKYARINTLADRQYEAHQTFIGAMYQLHEAALELHMRLDNVGASLEADDLSAEYERRWKQFSELRGLALLAGPKDVSDHVRAVAIAGADYANAIDRWKRGDGKPRNLDQLRSAFDEARSNYLDAAQESLSPGRA